MSKENEFYHPYTQNRELSWLTFDQRVLAEGWDEAVPLWERFRFAHIFTTNLDEFFMVRVGSLENLALVKPSPVDNKTGLTPAQQLSRIYQAVRPLYRRRDKLFFTLSHQLEQLGLSSLSPHQLTGKDRRKAERWFREQAAPVLSPFVVDSHHPFPNLPNKQLFLVLSLRREGRPYLGLLPIPKALPPFLFLDGPGLRYLLTEQLLLLHAPALFEHYTVTSQAVAAVTRSADLPLEDEESDSQEDFRAHLKKILKKRSRLAPVRLELQGALDQDALTCLRSRLGLSQRQVFFSKVPLSLDYLPVLEKHLPPIPSLRYPTFIPGWPAGLSRDRRMIPQLLRRDVLLCYPYQSMEPFLRLLRESSADPAVLSIKITIYRLASHAKLIEYLAAAAENGKDVTVLLELRARFDEQNNIHWAERLEEAGCTLIYGAQGYKVHAKLCLITRREGGRIQYITQVGTGNYNEKTAQCYTDLSLMTSHPAIGADAAALFQALSAGNLPENGSLLLLAPRGLRPALLALIDGEISKGKEGFLFLKMNSLTDRVLIQKLVQASQAGVSIRINVRGACCLLPGVPGFTDHIQIFSIVGRFLEHARLFVFGKGEDARMYLSSADFMTRNTQRRVEAACPILDPRLRLQLAHYIHILCHDTCKSRLMGPDGSLSPTPEGSPPLNAQDLLLSRLAAPPDPLL